MEDPAFIKIEYLNGSEDMFILGERAVTGIGIDPIIIYFDDDGRKWKEVISMDKIVKYTTNI